MSGSGPTHTVTLDMAYTAAGVIEDQTTERIDVEPGGAAVAFEFLPGVGLTRRWDL